MSSSASGSSQGGNYHKIEVQDDLGDLPVHHDRSSVDTVGWREKFEQRFKDTAHAAGGAVSGAAHAAEGAVAGPKKRRASIARGLFDEVHEDNDQQSSEHKNGIAQKASSYAVKSMRCMTFLITFGAYTTGFLALLFYAHHVRQYSHHLDFAHTMVPVIGHVIGIGIAITIKAYYDMSPKVGHVEMMMIIIRSRLWLFPGVLGPQQLQRRKRSEMEQEMRHIEEDHEEERKQQPWYRPNAAHELKFGMTPFLRKCQFPEFRVLFHAIDLYPWASISSIENDDVMDALSRRTQAQVMRAFPMLDFLNVFSSLPSILNPINHKRYIGNFYHYLRGNRSPAHAYTFEKNEVATRYEEVEQDDIIGLSSMDVSMRSNDGGMLPPGTAAAAASGGAAAAGDGDGDQQARQQSEWYERGEPLPWGTLRLTDYREKFHSIAYGVNFLSIVVFGSFMVGYMNMIIGEMHFYTLISTAHEKYLLEQEQIANKLQKIAIMSNFTLDEPLTGTRLPPKMNASLSDFPEYDKLTNHTTSTEWAEAYEPLRDFQYIAGLLLISLIPFAVQASALVAENSVVPMLVMDTMKYNVENFKEELHQYLTVLALHKGTLAAPDSGLTGTGAMAGKKVSMTRDMALSWRMNFLLSELERDASFVNSAVGLMMVNMVCHLVPLNLFVYSPMLKEDPCVPSWLIIFSLVQILSFYIIIKKAISCNELTNEEIDSMLHEWQLKFNMIGWSGGFIAPSDDGGFDVFIPNDPIGERAEDIKREEKNGHDGYGLKIQVEQQHRISSVVSVLAHYEAETLNPLKVLGLTVTADLMTLIIGFFGASIGAFVLTLVDRGMEGMVQNTFMCHASAFAGIHGNGLAGE